MLLGPHSGLTLVIVGDGRVVTGIPSLTRTNSFGGRQIRFIIWPLGTATMLTSHGMCWNVHINTTRRLLVQVAHLLPIRSPPTRLAPLSTVQQKWQSCDRTWHTHGMCTVSMLLYHWGKTWIFCGTCHKKKKYQCVECYFISCVNSMQGQPEHFVQTCPDNNNSHQAVK